MYRMKCDGKSPELKAKLAGDFEQWKRICEGVYSSLEKLERGLGDMIIDFQIFRSSETAYAVTIQYQSNGAVDRALDHIKATDLPNTDQVVNSLLGDDVGMTLADLMIEHRDKSTTMT